MTQDQKQKIRVGHSPDADDAFMFYGIAQKKIPLEGFEIEHVIEGIETLNERAFRAELEVTALSCFAFGHVSDRYQLLPYGASVGEGYGPILATRNRQKISSLRGQRIAVPGRYTTAYLLLQLYEKDFIPVFIPFDQIFSALEKGEADLGLLIHEGQLTYDEKGFKKVVDLGEWWRKKTGLPLPLGINAIRRDLGSKVISSFTRIFRQSLEYAFAHREEAMRYALEFGRGIDPKRGDQFVGMYVNEYSLELGKRGRAALQLLFDEANRTGLLPRPAKLEGFETAPS